jgi:streptomycin 6-kinase
VNAIVRRWSLTLGAHFDDVSCAWVASVALPDGTPAVLKFGMPHLEGSHEAAGLRFWDGNPTVRVLRTDEESGAILLERCLPGTPLRRIAEPEQDAVIATLLRRLWRTPPDPHPFRPLSGLMDHWAAESLRDEHLWPDRGLVSQGLALLQELPRNARQEVLLATDLHAGNVLRAGREPWLVIDPKPFVGDPAYDATQHLFNCAGRLLADPAGTIHRMTDLLCVDYRRVLLWTFARAAAEPRDHWTAEPRLAIAKAIGRLV